MPRKPLELRQYFKGRKNPLAKFPLDQLTVFRIASGNQRRRQVEIQFVVTLKLFLQAFQNIRSTNAELSLRAWLYKIATNNALRHHRRRRLLAFLPFGGDDSPGLADASADPSKTDIRLDIERALLRVPNEQRTALVLHYVEGLKYREIADVLSVSEEAVRKRVARGSEAFRSAYLPESGGYRA